MPTIHLPYKRIPADEKKYGSRFSHNSLSKEEFSKFNHSILGLGDLSVDGEYKQALAAFFDLKDFTDFSNQVDAHLVIPEYINRYVEWLFSSIKDVFTEGEDEKRVRFFGSQPFFAKFLGDGVLFIWDTELSGGFPGVCNVVGSLFQICSKYQTEFLPVVQKHVTKPPPVLRCGIARGQIISIGQRMDYVGPCINIASRLQKIEGLSFAVSRRGFDLSKVAKHDINKILILKKTRISGIGDSELVYVSKREFDALDQSQKHSISDV
jgi:hypothetical protein